MFRSVTQTTFNVVKTDTVRGGVLADEMGLGKVRELRVKTSARVAPRMNEFQTVELLALITSHKDGTKPIIEEGIAENEE